MLIGVNPFLELDVEIEPNEFFERVEGADDKSEKTGGVNRKPDSVSLSSRNKGDGGDKDASCFDNSSGDMDLLLVLFVLLILLVLIYFVYFVLIGCITTTSILLI
jgi:hypothetical protein